MGWLEVYNWFGLVEVLPDNVRQCFSPFSGFQVIEEGAQGGYDDLTDGCLGNLENKK
jgi:hypothetical protein